MNWAYILTGCIMLLIAGFVGADSVSSTIVCDGATWVSSSVISQGQTYAASLFTTNLAVLMRDLKINNGEVAVDTMADSSGPMGVDEYSGQVTNKTERQTGCVFDESPNRTRTQDEIMYMGLMGSGTYASARDLKSSEMTSITMMNGSGIMLARASSRDALNETRHTSDVAGNMNVTERIIFGGEE